MAIAPGARTHSTIPATSPATTLASILTASVLLVPAAYASTQPCERRAPTPETSRGPHDFSVLPAEDRLWRDGDAGEPLVLRARVLDTCGRPIAAARVRILHANHYGEHEPDRWRAELSSNARGEFQVTTVYPGYAGSLARHIHFIIEHPGYRPLVTRLFFKNDPAVDARIEPLAVVLDEVRHGGVTGWVGGYEFVLAPR